MDVHEKNTRQAIIYLNLTAQFINDFDKLLKNKFDEKLFVHFISDDFHFFL